MIFLSYFVNNHFPDNFKWLFNFNYTNEHSFSDELLHVIHWQIEGYRRCTPPLSPIFGWTRDWHPPFVVVASPHLGNPGSATIFQIEKIMKIRCWSYWYDSNVNSAFVKNSIALDLQRKGTRLGKLLQYYELSFLS